MSTQQSRIYWRESRPQNVQRGCLAYFVVLIVGIVLGAAAVWGGGQ